MNESIGVAVKLRRVFTEDKSQLSGDFPPKCQYFCGDSKCTFLWHSGLSQLCSQKKSVFGRHCYEHSLGFGPFFHFQTEANKCSDPDCVVCLYCTD